MATTVTIGGADATDVQVASATSLTAVVPAGTTGAADVVVSTSTDTATLADAYTYAPVPTVTDLTPGCVLSISSGNAMTLTGTGFTPDTTVTVPTPAFGTVSDLVVVDDTTITFTYTTDRGTNTNVQFTVTTPGGAATAAVSLIGTVQFAASNQVVPATGDAAGGNQVMINGANFGAGSTVMFGPTEITDPTAIGFTQLQVTVPPGTAGDSVDISVTNCAGSTGTLTDAYTYEAAVPAPTITAITPGTGFEGGKTNQTFTGTGLLQVGSTTSSPYYIAYDNAGTLVAGDSYANQTDTSVRERTPSLPAGTFDAVVVERATGEVVSRLADALVTTPAPTISAISPTSAAQGVKTQYTITGTDLDKIGSGSSGYRLSLNGDDLQYLSRASGSTATEFISTAVGLHKGPYDVRVVAPGSVTTSQLPAALTIEDWAAQPVLSSISPTQGPVGSAITVTGSGFDVPGIAWRIGFRISTSSSASNPGTVVSDTQMTGKVPNVSVTGLADVQLYWSSTSDILSTLTGAFTVTAPVTQVAPATAPIDTTVQLTATGEGLDQYTGWGVQLDPIDGVGDPRDVRGRSEEIVDENTVQFSVVLPVEGTYNITATDADGSTVVLGMDLVVGDAEATLDE